MLDIRKMEQKDFPLAVELTNTMGWNMTLADFEFNLSLEPDGCFVLLEDKELVGLATSISYGLVGWFGNLVVRETSQKRGAGAKLVQHALRYLNSRGVVTIGLYAYPHLSVFYGKLGFEPKDDFIVLKAAAVYAKPKSGTDMKVMCVQDLQKVEPLDNDCFGASRTKLLERIVAYPGNVRYLAVEGSEAIGYIAAKVFGKSAEVGPLACNRNYPEIAPRLLKEVLGRLNGIEAYMYVPVAETKLLEVAFQAGFVEDFRLTRMFLGPFVAKSCIYLAESLERG